jgi:putative aldouronate transport system substrate-binding protein
MLAKKILMATTALALSFALAGSAMAEPVKIRMVSKDLVTTNPADVAHIDRIEKAMAAQGTEIDIEIIDLPSSGYADALGVMLLSGDIPDLIYFQGGDQKMAEQGVLEDLTPWLEKMPNAKAALWPHNVERLKNYPYLLYIFPPRAPQPLIRTDWLEKTGMEPPDTIEEYEQLFTAIRDGDYDGNGQADTYGVTAFLNTNELDSIFNKAFGVTSTWMKNDAGEWVHSRITPQERDKIAWYSKLAAEGLFDKEYVTNKFDVKEDKFYTGRAGVIFGSSAEVIDIYGGKMRQVHPEAELVLLSPPKGPAGQGNQAIDVSKEARGFAIATTSEHKEEVMKLLDFMASPEGQMLDRLGFEGEEYIRNGDKIEVTDKISTWYARFFAAANWQPPVQWMSQAAAESLQQVNDNFVADNAFVFPAEFAADLDATENVYRSWVFKFISGEASMDQWDQYVTEWNNAGGQRLTDYARTVLNGQG